MPDKQRTIKWLNPQLCWIIQDLSSSCLLLCRISTAWCRTAPWSPQTALTPWIRWIWRWMQREAPLVRPRFNCGRCIYGVAGTTGLWRCRSQPRKIWMDWPFFNKNGIRASFVSVSQVLHDHSCNIHAKQLNIIDRVPCKNFQKQKIILDKKDSTKDVFILGKPSCKKKNVFFRALPEKGGGDPCPNFLTLFPPCFYTILHFGVTHIDQGVLSDITYVGEEEDWRQHWVLIVLYDDHLVLGACFWTAPDL